MVSDLVLEHVLNPRMAKPGLSGLRLFSETGLPALGRSREGKTSSQFHLLLANSKGDSPKTTQRLSFLPFAPDSERRLDVLDKIPPSHS